MLEPCLDAAKFGRRDRACLVRATVCISAIQFCENTVNNLRDSCGKNCKLLFFNNLHDTLNAPKYL